MGVRTRALLSMSIRVRRKQTINTQRRCGVWVRLDTGGWLICWVFLLVDHQISIFWLCLCSGPNKSLLFTFVRRRTEHFRFCTNREVSHFNCFHSDVCVCACVCSNLCQSWNDKATRARLRDHVMVASVRAPPSQLNETFCQLHRKSEAPRNARSSPLIRNRGEKKSICSLTEIRSVHEISLLHRKIESAQKFRFVAPLLASQSQREGAPGNVHSSERLVGCRFSSSRK